MQDTITFPPLHTDPFDQIVKAIGEEPTVQAEQRQKKIEFTAKHIDMVTHINGKRVFCPKVEDDSVHFFLEKPSEWHLKHLGLPVSRTHYYPIQYAEIQYAEITFKAPNPAWQWCKCSDSKLENSYYVEECHGIPTKHHWNCSKCHNVLQIG